MREPREVRRLHVLEGDATGCTATTIDQIVVVVVRRLVLFRILLVVVHQDCGSITPLGVNAQCADGPFTTQWERW
jgi:hypothetical protein